MPRSDKLRSRQIYGIHPVYQETFLHIHKLLRQLRILKNQILLERKTVEEPINSHVYSGEKWKTRTRPRSEMPVWTVSQRFSHPQWRRLFQELWGRPTTTADFRIFILTSSLLLEDNVQDPTFPHPHVNSKHTKKT